MMSAVQIIGAKEIACRLGVTTAHVSRLHRQGQLVGANEVARAANGRIFIAEANLGKLIADWRKDA